MKNIFILFESIINCKAYQPSEDINIFLANQIALVKREIKITVSEIKTSGEVEQYIQCIQLDLSNLFTEMEHSKDLKHADQSNETVSHSLNCLIYASLEQLFCFLESNYLKYLDKNGFIPCNSSLLISLEIEEKLNVVKSSLDSSGICSDLLKVIYEPFIKLDSINVKDRITYNQLNYFSIYLKTFYHAIIENNDGISIEHIIDILFEVNYNSKEFFRYEVNKLKEKLQYLEDESQAVDYLSYSLKIFNQKQSKWNLIFEPNLPSLKYQLTNWVEEEINYRKQGIDLTISKSTSSCLTKVQAKLKTDLSVSQLAYFYKLLVDAGIISHKNQRDIFRHIADCYSTSRVADISLESISNKYYAVESSTASLIRGYLIEMLNSAKAFN